MILKTLTITLIAFTLLLVPPTEVHAKVNAVPLHTLAADNSMQSGGMRISPDMIAAMMRQILYTKEDFFSSDSVSKVFHNSEISDLSIEISQLATELKPRQAIAFKTEEGRVRGYILLSALQVIWNITSIDGRPAERVTYLKEENASLDDSDSMWENKIEESYWQLSPQQGQSLYQDRLDWLLVPVSHVSSKRSMKKPRLATAAKPKLPSEHSVNDASYLSRIETLHKLLSMGLITTTDYKGKIMAIIAEYEIAHPAIENRLGLLLQLRKKDWINEGYYQTHKQELLKKL
jgi:hypothetical protein